MDTPGAPIIQLMPQASANSLTFYWQEPTTIGGAPITNYVLLNQTASTSTITGPSTYSIQISTLVNSQDYSFRLAAINVYGTGQYANFITAQPGTIASAVSNVVTTVAGINAIACSWSYVTNPNEGNDRAFVVTTTASTVNFSSIQTMAYADQSTILISNLPINTTSTIYTNRVQVINDAGWSPPAISNPASGTGTLALWLDGNDIDYSGISPRDGSRITRWIDKSGNGRHAIFTTGNPIVRASNQNNLFAAFFNGSSYLTVTYNSFPTVYTVFIVQYLSVNNGSYQRAFDNNGFLFVGANAQHVATFTGNGGWSDVLTNTPNINNFQAWCLVSMTVNSTTLIPYVNGVAQNTKTTITATFNNLFIGGSTQQWNGFIGEILIYTTVLNTVQRQEIEGYLARKWNLQRNLPVTHPFAAANPTSVMLPWIPSPAPTQPVITTFTNVTGARFTVNWTGAFYASSYTFTLNTIATVPISQTSTSATFAVNPNTLYSVQMVAINAGGTSSASTSASVTSGPGQPTALISSNVTQNAFTVNWSGGSGASSYTYTLNGAGATPLSSTSSSATFTNQLPGTTYTIIVTAINATGNTQSSPIQITTLGPSKPTTPQVTGINTTGFTLTWSGASGATSYNYLLNGAITVPSTDNGVSAKSATFTTLKSGTNYTIVVQAKDANNYTNSSDQITTKTLGPINPFNLWQTAGSVSGFTVNWLGGDGATSYTFTIGGNSATPPVNNGVTNKSASFSGLTIGTIYQVVVTATNADGSASSLSTSFYTVPTNPTSLTASAITGTQFTVSWSGAAAATRYTYLLNNVQTIPLSSTSSSATFSSLNAGTTYSVVVNAINPAGSASSNFSNTISPPSVSTNQLWLDAADPAGTGTRPSNGANITTWTDKSGLGYNASATGTTTYTTNLQNDQPGIFISSSYFTRAIPSGTFSNGMTMFVVYRNTASTTYNCLVTRSVNGSNLGAPDMYNQTRVVQGKFWSSTYNLYNTSSSVFSFTMNLATSTLNEWSNGSDRAISGTNSLTTTDTDNMIYIGSRGDQVTSLIGYFFEVILYNSVLSTTNRQLIEGYLAWKWGLQAQLPSNHPYFLTSPSTQSAPVQVSTAGPTIPTSLGQHTITTTGFTVTWSGGAGATSYQYFINNVLTTPQTDNGVSGRNVVFTGLALGSQYSVIVRAINADGNSNSIPVVFFTQLNQPTGVSSSGISSSAFTISWSPISGPTNLRISLNGNTIAPTSSTSTSATFSGLRLSTTYTVIVSNVNVSVSNQSTPLTVATLGAFSPKTISNNILWVDGADPLNTGTPPANGVAITTWFDKSGNSNNMTASVNGTYNTNSQNGLGTVAFASSVYRSAITNISYYPVDAYLVVKVNSITTANDICCVSQVGADNFNSLTFSEYSTSKWHNGSSGFSRTPNATASVSETSTSFLIMSWSIANNNFYIYRNGVQIMVTSSYSWTPTASVVFCLGTRVDVSVGNRLIGNIAEAAVYTTQLNTTNRQQVEGYLAWKWGLQTQLPSNHPFFTSSP